MKIVFNDVTMPVLISIFHIILMSTNKNKNIARELSFFVHKVLTRQIMGLTRQYLRYAAKSSFGLISSAKGGLVSLGDKNLVASATAENVTIWNLKTGK